MSCKTTGALPLSDCLYGRRACPTRDHRPRLLLPPAFSFVERCSTPLKIVISRPGAPIGATMTRFRVCGGKIQQSQPQNFDNCLPHPVSRSLGNFSLTCNFEFPTPDAQRSNCKEGTSILMCNVDICNTR